MPSPLKKPVLTKLLRRLEDIDDGNIDITDKVSVYRTTVYRIRISIDLFS